MIRFSRVVRHTMLLGIVLAACARDVRGPSRGTEHAELDGGERHDSAPTRGDQGHSYEGGASSNAHEGSVSSNAHESDASSNAPGPPPESCIPPCIWNLLVQCKVPGAGTPATASCVSASSAEPTCVYCDYDICDPKTGFAFKGSFGRGTIYVGGEPCFSYGPSDPSFMCNPIASYCADLSVRLTDATGQVVADMRKSLFAFIPPATYYESDVTCGARDDPAATHYTIDPQSPECEPWRAYALFPLYSPCRQVGSCEQ